MARDRIYTREGDDGTTGLFYGGRVAKDSELPRAYGAVDEAQAVMGLVRIAAGHGTECDEICVSIMRELWVLMAELATLPVNRTKLVPDKSSVSAEMVLRLEAIIDDLDTRFDPPTEFVVPGEHPVAAWLDLAPWYVAQNDTLFQRHHHRPKLCRISIVCLTYCGQWLVGKKAHRAPSVLYRRDRLALRT